jgi:serine/threonine protein kinase
VKSNGSKVPIAYMVLELVEGGDLASFVALGGFPEEICRFYFSKMIDAVCHLHKNGVAHRDLKPQNMLLDSKFNLLVTDFGCAGPIEGRDGSGYLKT